MSSGFRHTALRLTGNIRAVRRVSDGALIQLTDYYAYGTPSASVGPTANPCKYSGKELETRYGLNFSHHGTRLMLNDLTRSATPDPLAALTPGITPYVYCCGNPINHTDPSGREVILYATTLPGTCTDLQINFPTHTFIVVRNPKLGTHIFAYGPTDDGGKGVSGDLGRVYYKQDKRIAQGSTRGLKNKFVIEPPEGMTSDEFDQKVIDVANSFGNHPGIRYVLIPFKPTQGDCNSSTSTILLKSGVSPEKIDDLDDEMDGANAGFNSTPKPWTAEEQEQAAAEQQKLDEYDKRYNDKRIRLQ